MSVCLVESRIAFFLKGCVISQLDKRNYHMKENAHGESNCARMVNLNLLWSNCTPLNSFCTRDCASSDAYILPYFCVTVKGRVGWDQSDVCACLVDLKNSLGSACILVMYHVLLQESALVGYYTLERSAAPRNQCLFA